MLPKLPIVPTGDNTPLGIKNYKKNANGELQPHK
jgi:hypothetical protein